VSARSNLLLCIFKEEEVTTREVSGIKTLYKLELADAGWVLDETACECALLQIEIGKVQAELEEARKSAKEWEGELMVGDPGPREGPGILVPP
jgi:lamin B